MVFFRTENRREGRKLKENIQPIIVTISIILVWFLVVMPAYKKIKAYLKSKFSSSVVSNVIENKDEVNLSEVKTSVVSSNYFTVTNKITVFMREKYDAGVSCAEAIQGALNQFPSGVNRDGVLGYVAKAGYPAEDLAEAMKRWNYSSWDVRARISDDYNLRSITIAKILIKVFPKETDKEKLEMIFSSFEDSDVEELIPVSSDIFGPEVSASLIGEMLLQECDMSFADVVKKLNLKDNIVAIVEIATNSKTDITDSDEYGSFRDDDVSFEEMVPILFRMGKDAKTILKTEEEYDSFDFDYQSHRDSIFASLRSCGFSDKQIIEAVSSIDSPLDGLVLSVVENNVSLDDIVNYLKPDWANNLDGLWDELEGSLKKKVIVEIMYALIPVEQRVWKNK